MLLIENLIYFISIFFNFALGLLVFLKGRKEEINRTFFNCLLAAAGWLISLFIFFNARSPELVLWIGRFNFAIVIPLLYFLFKFALIFPRKIISMPKGLNRILAWWVFLITAVTFFTPLVTKNEIIIGPEERITVYGPLLYLYALHYIVFSIAVIFLLLYKIKLCKEKIEKIQVKYVLIGLSIALIWGFTTTIILSLFGLFEASNYAPLATVIFSTFVTAAILKHHLFNIRVLATEFFVGAVGFILLVQGLAMPTPFLKIIDFTILFLFLIFGYSLIRSVINEINYRQKLQIAYQEVEKLSKAKSEFISIASHQIRTPLTAIKGYISMILEGYYGKLADKAKTPLENVYKSNESLIKLVNDLLSISRIESGKIEFEPKESSIEEIVMGVVDDLKITAEKKRLYLKLEKPTESLPKIMLDKDKMRQVILNLVDNAIKYTQKGEITIDMKIIDSKLQILIRDTGGGMSKEDLAKLFESFSRGTVGSESYTGGTGLGLYIAKKFVEMHNGKIWAESAGIDKGSSFFVELPII